MSKVFDIVNDRSYYCSMKFKFLKIDLNSNSTYNCHAAQPHPIDFNSLRINPGSLFNTDINVQERQMMLDNKRNASCEQNCWYAEDHNAVSPRLYQQGQDKTHTDIHSQPEQIDLTINTNCNLTCTYCCKEYSSSWRNDIIANGDYSINGDRYRATDKDKVLNQISQKELKNSNNYKTLLSEFSLITKNLKELTVTGGEPFLDNSLIDILKSINVPEKINIYSGLGVNISRFGRYLSELKNIPNVNIIISAETTSRFLEFNRYGIKWDEFVDKVNLIRDSGIKFSFQSTLSNLTLFDFPNFFKYYSNENFHLTFAYNPKMMAPFVLDPDSKKIIQDSLIDLPDDFKRQIMQSMIQQPDEHDRIAIKTFLIEFVKRRPDLNLNIFPVTFLKWLEIYVV